MFKVFGKFLFMKKMSLKRKNTNSSSASKRSSSFGRYNNTSFHQEVPRHDDAEKIHAFLRDQIVTTPVNPSRYTRFY